MIVGIDLGTTYSLVATLQGGRPVVLRNGVGEILTPSVVGLLDNGDVVVGAAAKARLRTHPERTAARFKTDMGTDRTFRLADQVLSPVQLSSLVLAQLKADAEAALGTTIDQAVVTVPAYFGDAQRQATRAAAEMAGLQADRIINEPTAAAIAYGLHNLDDESTAVVLDLGGGTFDVTVLDIIEGVVEVRASAGDARLGGEDFTDALVALVGAPEGLDERDTARLRAACDRAKIALTTHLRATVAVPDLGGADFSADLDRARADRAWADLLGRMRQPILRALRDAGVDPREVDNVLLVGGATRTPCVQSLAAEIFGKLPRHALPPDEAVAMGAAVQAALMVDDAAVEDLVVTDVAPFSLGIGTASEFAGRRVIGVFSPIIERGTVIPTSRQERYSTMENGQRSILVEVFQGEHAMCSQNTRLGSYEVKGLPRKPAGEVAVDVRFTYDLNGILEVETQVVGSEKVQSMVIEQRPGKLSKAEIAAAREAMRSLKFHPRDALPNQTALARADALYAELTGPARTHLGEVLAAFRGALEQQSPEDIEELRGILVRMTEELSR